ncbi:hypothetical protein RE432_14985 [Pusillimonas sp. SM2304]|uniref:hypothetical protein n=1 Tax=Pusillimonas sp. SM2304 TaxID=3073241 RepID=UPI00287402F4|nr:hypothetical protein [Pusillimonas sp. SM2304]MDS1141744.1 hypothetical protein [Pusillimonas sp. SM2304]
MSTTGKCEIYPIDMSLYGCVVVEPIEIEYEIPADFNRVAAEVAALDKQIEAVRGEFTAKLQDLSDKKAQLLCIENGVSA